ncbi:MAG: radical SAM family heme chaperone HemW, partial [Bacteroidetes bacterium]|nr:radical SAM family heme chaperone HemW [Bacteroidota bacterium]
QLIDTIYFGGGTPSVLSEEELDQIFSTLHQYFSINPKAEITLEANPDDLSPEKLEILKNAGVNRLSIGIQSFFDRDLQWMNRSHNREEAIQCIKSAREVGINNISADLIFGLPHLSQEEWEANLRQMIDLEVNHLSLYALTVEEKTFLNHQVKNGTTQIPDDSLYEKQFLFAHEFLATQGFDHYELSNYARPGFHSQHNSSYWKGIPYLGLGPSAHSFDGKERSWNIANNQKYLTAISQNQTAITESETLTIKDLYHEYIMTHIRKKEGIDTEYIEKTFIRGWQKLYQSVIDHHLNEGNLTQENNVFRPTPEGWLISDQIIRDFFILE